MHCCFCFAAATVVSLTQNHQQTLPIHTRVPLITQSMVTAPVSSGDQGRFILPSVVRPSFANSTISQGGTVGVSTGTAANSLQPQRQNIQPQLSSSQAVHVATTPGIGFGQSRTSSYSPHETRNRVTVPLPHNHSMQRLVGPVAGVVINNVPQPPLVTTNVTQSSLSTSHHSRGGYSHPTSNQIGSGNSLVQDSTHNGTSTFTTAGTPHCSTNSQMDAAVGSLPNSSNAVIPQENHGSSGVTILPEIPSNASESERPACDNIIVENMARPPDLNVEEVLLAHENRCTISTRQVIFEHANQDTLIQTSMPSPNFQPNVINVIPPPCPEANRNNTILDVICLSDDD